MDFDDVFHQTGGFGYYQATLFAISLLMPLLGTETIFMNFVGYELPHWCREEALANLPFSTQLHVAIPKTTVPGTTTKKYDGCKMYALNYSSYSAEDFMTWNRSQMVSEDTRTKACTEYEYDRSVMVSSIVTEWDLVCDRGWLVPLVTSIALAGTFVGAGAGGVISDRWGRKKALYIFCTMKVVFGVLAVVPSYFLMLVARFGNACGNTACYSTGLVLVLEQTAPKYRPAVGMVYGIFYSISFMLVAVFAYAVRDYTRLQIIMAAPLVVLLASVFMMPESPRWLLMKGHADRAEKIVRTMAEINGRRLKDSFDIRNFQSKVPKSQGTLLDIYRSPTLRKYALILHFHWFVDVLMFFALSLNTGSLSGSIFLNTFLSGTVEIPSNLIAIPMLSTRPFGRRLTCSFSLLVAGSACLVCVPLLITNASPISVTVLSLLGKAGVTIAFNAMYVYTVELFPTDVRNAGLGASSMWGRVGGILAPFIGGPLGKVWLPLPSLIFGTLAVLAGGLGLLLPETLGQQMFETVVEFDDPKRVADPGLTETPLEVISDPTPEDGDLVEGMKWTRF